MLWSFVCWPERVTPDSGQKIVFKLRKNSGWERSDRQIVSLPISSPEGMGFGFVWVCKPEVFDGFELDVHMT